jgi:hypothetical protein
VSGCVNNANGSTTSCPAAGGVILTLAGTGFGANLVALVGGQACANLTVTSATTLGLGQRCLISGSVFTGR